MKTKQKFESKLVFGIIIILLIFITANYFVEKNQQDFVALGYEYFYVGDIENALLVFKQHIELNPKDDIILAEIGISYYEIDNFIDAKTYFLKSLKINNKNTVALVGLSKLYLVEDDLENYNNVVDFLLSIKPNDSWIYLELGITLFRKDMYPEAHQMFLLAYKYDSNNDVILKELGWNYYELRNFSKALESFNKSIKINPNNDLALAGIGTVYSRLNNSKDAIGYFKRALKINPNNKLSYYKLGRIYYDLNQDDKAMNLINKSIELSVDYLNDQKTRKSLESSYQVMGLIALRQGNTNSSIDYFEKSLELDTNVLDEDYILLTKEEVRLILLKLK